MATLIRPNGEKKQIYAPEYGFTLAEISRLLNGLVDFIYNGEYWVLFCKNGESLKRTFNSEASNAMKIKLYGDVLITYESELSEDFIMEVKNEAGNVNTQPMTEIQQKDMPKEEDVQKAKEFIMDTIFNNIFNSGKTLKDFLRKFELYNDGKQCIIIPPVIDERIKSIDNVINYFSDKEEYEKCTKLVEFKNKIVEYYQEF